MKSQDEITPRALKRLIEQSELTREEFARRLGVSMRQVYRWLSRENTIPPSKQKLIRFVLTSESA